jgi:hypothetical protein
VLLPPPAVDAEALPLAVLLVPAVLLSPGFAGLPQPLSMLFLSVLLNAALASLLL